MKIGIDLDSTINNIVEIWLCHYNVDWQDTLALNDIKTWNMSNFVKPEAKNKIYNYLTTPGFFYFGVNLQPNVLEGINYLKNLGHELYIITSYIPESCLDKYKWVSEFVPKINPANIIFCNNKSIIDLDALIDDGIHNFEGFRGSKIIFTQPWNTQCPKEKYTYRLNNWKEINQIELFKSQEEIK